MTNPLETLERELANATDQSFRQNDYQTFETLALRALRRAYDMGAAQMQKKAANAIDEECLNTWNDETAKTSLGNLIRSLPLDGGENG